MNERVAQILAMVPASPVNISWPDANTKKEAFDLYKSMTGQRLKMSCPTCSFTVVNYFRSLQGLPALKDEAPGHLRRERLAICRGVLVDGSDACEHLAWPGMNCEVCGCFVDLKAIVKKQKCPKGKW